MIDRVSYSDEVFRNGVSWSQSSVFRFLKMWYDDSTARLDRFSHIALKLTLGLQNLFSFFRFALFDGEISSWADFKRVNIFYICDKIFILVHLLSVGIFDICFQWDSNSKISIFGIHQKSVNINKSSDIFNMIVVPPSISFLV